jgi:hypothetical protein
MKGGESNMQSTIEETNLFKSAYLLASGGDFKGIRFKSGNPRMAAFMFSGHNLDKLEMDYRQGTALVNPLQLRECLNHLRGVLFEKLRNREGRMINDRRSKRSHQHRCQP